MEEEEKHYCLNREYVCEVYARENSERVGPNKLLWDGIFWHISEFPQEGTTLKVKIQAVTKAKFFFTLECIRLSTERVLYGPSTFFEACKSLLADFLSKTKSEKAVFNLFLLSCDIVK